MQHLLRFRLVAALSVLIAVPAIANAAPANVTFNVPVSITFGPSLTGPDGVTPATLWQVSCQVYGGGANVIATGLTPWSSSPANGQPVTIVAPPNTNWINNPTLKPSGWECMVWLRGSPNGNQWNAANSLGMNPASVTNRGASLTP